MSYNLLQYSFWWLLYYTLKCDKVVFWVGVALRPKSQNCYLVECTKRFGTPSSKFKYSLCFNSTVVAMRYLIHVKILYQKLDFVQHKIKLNYVKPYINIIPFVYCTQVFYSLLWIEETWQNRHLGLPLQSTLLLYYLANIEWCGKKGKLL